MKISNSEIKELLIKKGEIIEKGRALNKVIDAKGERLIGEYLLGQGLSKVGTRDGKDLFKGTAEQMQVAFNSTNNIVINDLMQKELDTELSELKKLELQILKIQDKLIPLVNEATKPLLKEFEEVGTIEIAGDEIEFNIINVLEDFKKNYTEKNAR